MRGMVDLKRLRMNWKQCVWIVALTLGVGITGVAASSSLQKQHDQDYSKNKKLQGRYARRP